MKSKIFGGISTNATTGFSKVSILRLHHGTALRASAQAIHQAVQYLAVIWEPRKDFQSFFYDDQIVQLRSIEAKIFG